MSNSKRTVEWGIDYEVSARDVSGKLRWMRSRAILQRDEHWTRQEFAKRKEEGLPSHMRGLRLIKVITEVVEE